MRHILHDPITNNIAVTICDNIYNYRNTVSKYHKILSYQHHNMNSIFPIMNTIHEKN